MTSATLANLSTETLQQIFSTFCLHCRAKYQSIAPDAYLRGTQQHRNDRSWYSLERHALFSLCLVSRRFCNIAQPIMYHEFVLGYGDSWRSTVYTWDGRLTSFVRAVVQRRDLAILVKRIYIHPYLLKSISDEEARNALERAIYTLEIEPWQQWSGGELVTILIAKLPNLEHFSLQVNGFPFDNVCPLRLRTADVSILRLRTIDISKRATPRQSQYSLFSLDCGIFELATGLQTLNLHMCGGIWRRAPIPSLPNLKTLRITYSRLGETDLEDLLSSCSGLRTFFYEATSPRTEGQCSPIIDGRDHFKLSNAVKYLSRHRTTLKSLHLDLRERGWPPINSSRTIRPIFSLRDFTALEHLFLNSSKIYGDGWKELPAEYQLLVQLLPPGITSLHLEGHIGKVLIRLAKGLLGLADAVSQDQFPRLKQVRCDAQQRLPDNEYAMGAMFAAAGVDFDYDSWPLSQATLRESDVPPPPTSFEPMPLPVWDDDDDL
jgi:hypothetical protein